MTVPRIDVHQHLVPPRWAEALASRGMTPGGWTVPSWDPGSALRMMDEQSIATGVLSVTAPGVHLGDDAEARSLARSVNESAAEAVRDRPERFGFFASLPLPDTDGALEEAAYALDTLDADGVVLLSSVRGRYLGDPDYAPLWAELDRRAACVFVHPGVPPVPQLPGTPAPLVDFVFDTTRAAVQLVRTGVMARCGRVRVVLAHGGGFLPYAAHRFARLSALLDASRDSDTVLADLRRFYFDTALSAGPESLLSLLAFAHPGHVLYGSDWPFAPQETGAYFAGQLESRLSADPGLLHAVARGNAETLFPRLRSGR